MAKERSIVVRLRAEVADFKNQMNNASRSLSDFEKSQEKMGGAATTTLGRLAQSAKINEQEWRTVGRTLTVAGGAVTGLGIAALKTGIEYNSLRQNATKSLESVTGSTEAAAAQMQRLDDYGQNSWLMRDVLIKAQQNMSGFGIETGKVIPYMDALAEAVAGTTGSQQNFEDLAQVMGKIQSQGKITARELNEFGLRGIDAAQLIGDAMGKTADQIRSEITAGTLDAETALDALAEGMSTKFEGSSDRLRDTFQGAVDNVMGAWRDLGAELAKPLVNPEGGGLLVDFMNNLADSLNRFKDSPGWLKGTVTAISGLTGVTALAGGAFMLAVPKIDQFKTSVQTLANTHPVVGKLSGALGKLSKAAAIGAGITITAGAFIKLADALGDSGIPANADRITAALSEVNDMNIDTLFLDATAGMYDLNDAMGHLMDLPFGHEWGMDVAETLGITSNQALNAKNTFEELDSTLAEMVQSGEADKAAQLFDLLYENLDHTKYSVEDLKAMLPGYEDALAGAAGEAEIAADNSEQLADSFLGIGSSAEDAAGAMQEWIELVQNAGDSFGGLLDAYDRVMEKNEDLKLSNSQTMEQWIAEMQEQASAMEDWADNATTAIEQANTEMTGQSQEMHQAFVKEMIEAGAEGAEALQTFVDGTPEQRAELIEAWAGTKDDIGEVINAGDDLELDVDGNFDPAKESLTDFLDKVIDANPLIGVDADTEPADMSVAGMYDNWMATTTDTNVDANTAPAIGTTTGLFNAIANKTTDTNVDANTAPAAGTTTGLFNQWRSTTTDTNVDANTGPAIGTTTGLYNSIAGTTTNTNVDANTSPAAGTTQGLYNEIAGTTTSTNVDANTQPARNAITNLRNWFAGQEFTKTVNIIEKKGGKFHGGWVTPGRYEGGLIDIARTVPGRKAGGWVPGERAGYDNVMWPLHSGGQVLNQPLEGREFVVNSRDAARYPAELNAMNNGTYPTNTLERAYSPTQQIDYQKLATALRGREHIEQHMHLHTANATITEGIDGFNRMNMAESRR